MPPDANMQKLIGVGVACSWCLEFSKIISSTVISVIYVAWREDALATKLIISTLSAIYLDVP